MNKLSENVRKKMSEKRLTQEKLSEKADVSQAIISRIVRGKNKTMKAENILKLAKALNTTSEWLLYGHSEEFAKGQVPVISYVQAGNWTDIVEDYHADKWQSTTIEISSNAFALRVKGDSMLNPIGSPSIPEQSIVIVDPAVQPENGSIVVARLNDIEEATIKKLVIDMNNKYLKPLNPDYQTLQIDCNCVIVGVVKQVIFDL